MFICLCVCVCVCVAKDLANHCIDIVFLFSKALNMSWEEISPKNYSPLFFL